MKVTSEVERASTRPTAYACWACTKAIKRQFCEVCRRFYYDGHSANCPCRREEHTKHPVHRA